MATARGANSLYDCPICCERYKNPKIISCGHSFCLSPCLNTLIKSDSLNCPLCRTPIQVPPSGKIEDLPTNFALQSLTEDYTANLEGLTLKGSNAKTQMEQKSCSEHEQDYVVYCKTCSELLCSKCLDESHHDVHDTMDIQEIVDAYCERLDSIAEEVTSAYKQMDDIFCSLRNTKERCKAEAESVIATIDEAAESVIQQVRERTRELLLAVEQRKCKEMKKLEEVEARGAELSLSFEYTRSICKNLKSDLLHLQFKRRNAVDSISQKIATLLKNMSDFEKEAVKVPDSVTFIPSQQLVNIPLGKVVDGSEGTELHESLSKLKDVLFRVPEDYYYEGFIFLTTNVVIFICYKEDLLCLEYVRLICHFNKSQKVIKDFELPFKLMFDVQINLTSVNTGNQKTLVFSTSQEVYKITVKFKYIGVSTNGSEPSGSCDLDIPSPVIRLSDGLLYRIKAISLDEMGENCYALLDDGYTIKLFNFAKRTDAFHLRLEEKVECTNSKGFHVTKFGMVICEKDKIRFYETTKSPRTTRIIRNPSRMIEGCPVCVTSQDKGKKWFVLWAESVLPESFFIYQYSASFQEELLLLKLLDKNVNSFYILDEHYLALEVHEIEKVTLSVYYINRHNTNNPPTESEDLT